MNPRDMNESDRLLHRTLSALPQPKAPATLIPRVMAAVAAREARREVRTSTSTWLDWPLVWQALSIAALAVLALGVSWAAPGAHAFVAESTAVRIAAIVWSTYLQPVTGYVVVWMVMMSAACALVAGTLGRVALGGASH
jgi:hypothetical protein